MSIGVAGCGGEETLRTGPAPMERPDEVNIVERSMKSRSLPPGIGEVIRITKTATGTLVGTDNGLYALTTDGMTRLHSDAVVDLVTYEGLVLVAQSTGIYIWGSGILTLSPITEELGVGEITGLAIRGDALWISTTAGLFEYTDGALSSVMEPVDSRGLHGGLTASYVSAEIGESGHYWAIEPGQDTWQILDFTDSEITEVRPGDQSLYALSGGALLQYLTNGSSAVWRRIALTMGEGPEGDISTLATSASGQLWGLNSQLIFQHTRGTVNQIIREDDLQATRLLVDEDGVAWLSDGETLTTYFDAPPSTIDASWAASINAFAVANCDRCHGELGTAHGLHTQAQWTAEIDNIIRVLGDGSMPADGATLVLGDAALLQAWKDGGLR